ncbi:MAG TPA: MFS transporter [Anaerolineales bacterium]|nr:MFS transporter [Anaerolineales bacterium]
MEATPTKPARPITKNMRTFFVIWSGQLVSTIGSGLTGFALGVWIYQETGSVTLFAMNMLAFAIPNLLVSPFAGAMVDRYDRRWVMILSDTGAGLATLSIAILYMTGNLQVWNIILATAFNSAFSTFQWPAYSAVTTLLVPKEQLGRAGGMVQIGEAMSQLLAPAAAGALFVTVGLGGVIVIDFVTYFLAVLTLLVVRVPSPERSEAGKEGQGSIWKEALYGWTYISARAGLLGLLLVFAAFNFVSGLMMPLIMPMILDMTSAAILGYLVSIVGVGMLAGTLVMSAWGGPKRRIHGVLGFLMLSGFFTSMLGISPLIPVMAVAGFFLMFTMPIINGSSQAIWQSKVDPDVQGRVFSVRRMIAWSMTPLAYIVAGPLADRVFKPLLMEGGALADSIGQLIGVGPGRGTGLMFMVVGALSIVVAALGYLNPHVRNVEDELPDVITPEDSKDEPESGEDLESLAAMSQAD